MSTLRLSDGVCERTIEIDFDGKARSRLTQPTRNLILEENAELQRNPGAVDNLSFMGSELRIPFEDWHYLRKTRPDLFCHDQEIRTRAWQLFLRSSESDPYRIRSRKRGNRKS